jgi:hypothetical protein
MKIFRRAPLNISTDKVMLLVFYAFAARKSEYFLFFFLKFCVLGFSEKLKLI